MGSNVVGVLGDLLAPHTMYVEGCHPSRVPEDVCLPPTPQPHPFRNNVMGHGVPIYKVMAFPFDGLPQLRALRWAWHGVAALAKKVVPGILTTTQCQWHRTRFVFLLPQCLIGAD